MIKVRSSGSFKKMTKFFSDSLEKDYLIRLAEYGRQGVDALARSTPVDSGKTAESWGFEIHESKGSVTIHWTNENIKDGVPVAILIQYGHGVNGGGYVQGRDFINPTMRPIFDKIANDAWKEITK